MGDVARKRSSSAPLRRIFSGSKPPRLEPSAVLVHFELNAESGPENVPGIILATAVAEATEEENGLSSLLAPTHA